MRASTISGFCFLFFCVYSGATLSDSNVNNAVSVDPKARALILTVSQTAPAGNSTRISSKGVQAQRLQAVSGQPVELLRTETQERLKSVHWRWVTTEDRVVKEDSLSILPVLNHDQVTLKVTVRNQNTNETQQLSTSVQGKLGQWIQIMGDTPAADTRVISSGKRYSIPEQLFVLVEEPK